jgi:hypothetical protein
MVPPGFQSFATPVLDTFKFCQFLAKIAHCFAVDVLGDGFVPMLTEMIRSEPKEPRFDLIGGGSQDTPPSDNLHELSLAWQRGYAVVSIRLFSDLGAPTYLAVAGKSKAA